MPEILALSNRLRVEARWLPSPRLRCFEGLAVNAPAVLAVSTIHKTSRIWSITFYALCFRMATLINHLLPSRRRERKQQKAWHRHFHPRWGDASISAPSPGGWNQPVFVSNTSSGDSSTKSSPEINPFAAKAIGAGVCFGPVQRLAVIPRPKAGSRENGNNITITIPLPWTSRKSHTKTSSADISTNSAIVEEKEEKLISPTHQTAVVFKPASEGYMKDLADLSNTNAHDKPSMHRRSGSGHVTSPISNVVMKPVSEDYMQSLSEMGLGINATAASKARSSKTRSSSSGTRAERLGTIRSSSTSSGMSCPAGPLSGSRLEITRAASCEATSRRPCQDSSGPGASTINKDLADGGKTPSMAASRATGYYTGLVSEYRRIAMDCEAEMRTEGGAEGGHRVSGKKARELDKPSSRRYEDEQALVPDASELYG